MNSSTITTLSTSCVLALVTTSFVNADVDFDWVHIGDPGNLGEQSRLQWGDTDYYGDVPYTFQISKYEVTAGQYTVFLNAVARDDTHGLYNPQMQHWYTCGITRNGTTGNYTYHVLADYENRPIAFVSWLDAARFVNWLHNGQPERSQDVLSTEGGAYDLSYNPAFGEYLLRNCEAIYFLPSEDEWYKAAYYDPDKPGGAGYWVMPTQSDTIPTCDILDLTNPGNNANCNQCIIYNAASLPTTVVGEFQLSQSAYGTYGQAGNVEEWIEPSHPQSPFIVRGGCWESSFYSGEKTNRIGSTMTEEWHRRGFRVAMADRSAVDRDKDNVIDSVDLCPDTPPNTSVDDVGRPLGDLNQDCRTDLADYALFQMGYTGPFAFQPTGVSIETVAVRNAGNNVDTDVPGISGAVAYVFHIGKYEVTAGQYAAFLNATAKTDTYNLWHPGMVSTPHPTSGCGIERTGTAGNYVYTVDPDRAKRPVTHVSWADAARFANWLNNGQPAGPQDINTTEDGAYLLDGAEEVWQLVQIIRKPDAVWALPTSDEWYKAAYHKNDGVTGNYFDYPTSSDVMPSSLLDGGGNNATYGSDTIGFPYFRTEVGAHLHSESPYGTFDQAGNVREWNEELNGTGRGVFGGFWGGDGSFHSTDRAYFEMTNQDSSIGFRVVRLDCTH